MDWDKLRIFHAVAEAGSFTHAGEILNLSQSSVSRQISSLEETLNAPLFHRHARGLTLTEQGHMLYQTAKEVFSKLAMAEALVSEARDRPQGPLRISSPTAFGSIWLTERLREFIEMYPDIGVSLIVSDDELDLSMGAADVAIRATPPRQPDLIQRKLITMHHRAFASSTYVQEHGSPRELAELDEHRLVAYDETISPSLSDLNWLLSAGLPAGRTRRPVLRVNNIYAMFRATVAGLGIASLPDYMARLSISLVPLLGEHEGPPFTLYLSYPEELRHSKRIGVFREFLLRRIGSDLS